MKFDYVSDFHAPHNRDFFDWAAEKKSDILILNGDTSNSVAETIRVLEEASKHYQDVLFTDGNHDHYHNLHDKSTVEKDNRRFCFTPSNVHFFDHHIGGFGIEDTYFLGVCGWYDWNFPDFTREAQYLAWKTRMNDSRLIRFDENGFPDKLAAKQADYLTRHVRAVQPDDSVSNVVIFTHTVPVLEGLLQKPADLEWQLLNGSYYNSLMHKVVDADINKKIKVWCFGHTHRRLDFSKGHIRYISNPRGYSFERTGYEGILQVDTNLAL